LNIYLKKNSPFTGILTIIKTSPQKKQKNIRDIHAHFSALNFIDSFIPKYPPKHQAINVLLSILAESPSKFYTTG